jgi:hypothetical protein
MKRLELAEPRTGRAARPFGKQSQAPVAWRENIEHQTGFAIVAVVQDIRRLARHTHG